MEMEKQLIRNLEIQRLKSKFGSITLHKQVNQSNMFHIKPDEKYDYIKFRLTTLLQYFLDTLNITNFNPVNTISTESIYIYGMIFKFDTEKLNINSVYIMSNIDASNNVIVRLAIDSLESFSLFPGQIVALYGINTTGTEFVVSKICAMPELEVPEVELKELELYNEIYKKKDFVIHSVSGPFLSQDGSIIDKILKLSCDILILCGPFLDSNTVEYDTFNFIDSLMHKIDTWLRKSTIRKVIFIPSVDDTNSIGLYPQPKMQETKEDRVFYYSNPCMFSINEILFSVSTFDNMMCLATEECYKQGYREGKDEFSNYLFSKDRIFRLSTHLIYQKSFAPVFPLKEPVDYSNPSDLTMKLAPHIFITTSKLKEFDKYVGPSRVINLGMQTNWAHKKIAKIQVKPMEENLDICPEHRFEVSFNDII